MGKGVTTTYAEGEDFQRMAAQVQQALVQMAALADTKAATACDGT